MSKGLSRAQRLILEALGECNESYIDALAGCVYHEMEMRISDDTRDDGVVRFCLDYGYRGRITRTQYVATSRAIRSLERRGLVRGKIKTYNGDREFTRGKIIVKC